MRHGYGDSTIWFWQVLTARRHRRHNWLKQPSSLDVYNGMQHGNTKWIPSEYQVNLIGCAEHAFNKVSFSTLLQAFLDDEIHDSRSELKGEHSNSSIYTMQSLPKEITCRMLDHISGSLEMVNVYWWDMSIAFLAHVWLEMDTEAGALSMHVCQWLWYVLCVWCMITYTDKNVPTAGAPYTALCHILWKVFYFL